MEAINIGKKDLILIVEYMEYYRENPELNTSYFDYLTKITQRKEAIDVLSKDVSKEKIHFREKDVSGEFFELVEGMAKSYTKNAKHDKSAKKFLSKAMTEFENFRNDMFPIDYDDSISVFNAIDALKNQLENSSHFSTSNAIEATNAINNSIIEFRNECFELDRFNEGCASDGESEHVYKKTYKHEKFDEAKAKFSQNPFLYYHNGHVSHKKLAYSSESALYSLLRYFTGENGIRDRASEILCGYKLSELDPEMNPFNNSFDLLSHAIFRNVILTNKSLYRRLDDIQGELKKEKESEQSY